jgi:hypothetical protein
MINYPAIMGLILISVYFVGQSLKCKQKPKSIQRSIYLSESVLSALVVIFIFQLFSPFLKKEKFFFEVSPARDKCLREQVSRNNYGQERGCACCGKGTVGGIPPNYAEWSDVNPDTGDRWHRPDNVQYVSTFSNGEEAVCRPFTSPSYIQYV